MEFDPSTAKEIGWHASFDPSTATEEKQFDPTSAEEFVPEIKHDWGTTDARDKGVSNHPPKKFDPLTEFSPLLPKKNLVDRNAKVPTPGQELSADLWKRTTGIGVDIADLIASVGPQVWSWAEAAKRGDNSVSTGHAMEEVRQQGALREQMPNLEKYPANPAIQGALEKVTEGVKLVTDKAFGPNPTPAKIAAEDALMLVLLGGAGKAMKGKGAVEAPKTDASIIAKNLEPVLQDVNTEGMKTPQYMSPKERGLAQESVTATGEPAFGEMNYKINEKEYNKPYWPDQDLQKSMEQANNVVDDASTMQGMKDVNAESIKSPYMSEAEVKTAQGFADAKDAPAAWEMENVIDKDQFNKWLDKSIDINNKGEPNVWYHTPTNGEGFYTFRNKGTAFDENGKLKKDMPTFIFLSDNPQYGKKVLNNEKPPVEFITNVKNTLDLTSARTLKEALIDTAKKSNSVEIKQLTDKILSEYAGKYLLDKPVYGLFHSTSTLGSKLYTLLEKAGYDSVKITEQNGRRVTAADPGFQTQSLLLLNPDQLLNKKELAKAFPKETETTGAVSKMTEQQRQRDVQTNAKLANELHQAKNLPEAVTTVRKYLKDPDQLGVAEVLQRFVSKDVGFEALNPDDVAGRSKDSAYQMLNDSPNSPGALGLHITGEKGSQQVAVRGINYFLELKGRDGLNPETVLHETVHSITDKAFYVATHPDLIKDPKYSNHVAYAADMNDLRLSLMKELPPDVVAHFDAAFENAAEFNAYGWTSPNFREALSKIELKGYGKNAWARFKDIVKQFFGQDIQTTNALKAIDGFMDRLDYIQHADKADVGAAVARLNKATESVSKQVDKPKTADELKTKFPVEDIPDLNSFTGKNVFTSNQVKNIVKHPWVDFTWEKINTIKREEELKQATRRDVYEEFVKPIKEDDLIKIEKAIIDATVEPYEVRAQVEAGGRPAIVDFYKSRGLTAAEADKAAYLQSILRDVEGSDRGNASLLGRDWQHQPLYAPLSHGGRFRVIATDINGDVVMARGYHSASDAAMFYTELKKLLAENKAYEGITLENVKRSELNSLKSDMAEMMLSQALPEYLKKQVQSVEKTMEVSRRRFEMERRAKAVAGYVGEDLGDPTTGYGKRQRQALIDAFEARIDASFDFGVKARIAKEILDPLLTDPAVQSLRPELHNYLNQLIMREMGFPISKTANLLDRPLQAFADKAFGKPMNNLSNMLNGREPNDVSMLGPRAVENLVQGWTWATSLAKLGWNMNTWLANSTAIPFVSLEGWRVAHKERVSPWYAVLAANDSRQFALGLGDTSAKAWMEKAKREGMVDALVSDTYTLDPSVRRKLPDRIVNAPRDALEYATNYNTIQYFYHFYKHALGDKVDVNSEAFKTKVYEAARSWTGDYSEQATPLGLSQLGTAGRGMGNFSKWRFNQLGRLVDDVSTLKDNPTSGHAWGALVALLTTQTLMGGLYGLTGVADYEALRRFGQWTGAWEWRPFSMWYEEANKALGNNIPDWARKGAITAGSDAIAQAAFGEESGPDLSGSLRYASFLELPTVSMKYFMDVLGGLDWAAKRGMQATGIGMGVSHQESKEAIDALPTSIKSALNDYFKVKTEEDGKTRYLTQQKRLDQGQYSQTPFQRNLDLAGLKTTKENDYNDKVFAGEWLKKHTSKQIGERLAAALNWAVEPAGRSKLDATGINNPDSDLVTKNLQEAYNLGGITSLRQFEAQLKGKPLDRATTYDQRLIMDVMRQQDPMRKKQLLEILQKFIDSKESRNTSSNR